MMSEYEFEKLMGQMDREDEILEAIEASWPDYLERNDGDFEDAFADLQDDANYRLPVDWTYVRKMLSK